MKGYALLKRKISLLRKEQVFALDRKIRKIQIETRDPWLDVLRGVAIFLVVAVHTMHTSDAFTTRKGGKTNGFFTRLASNGAWGVELFFFLSGWLLCSIYQTTGDPVGKKYWYRRMSRILPLWTFFLAIEISRNFLHLNGTFHDLLTSEAIPHNALFNELFVTIISALTFTLWFSAALWNGVIPGGWSIQAEVGHYLLFPLIRNRNANKIFLFLTFINLGTFYINLLDQKNFLQNHFFHLAVSAWVRLDLYATFGYFLMGVFSYKFIQEYTKSRDLLSAYQALGINVLNLALYLLVWLFLPITFTHHGQMGTLAFVLFYILLSRIFLKVNFLRKLFIVLGRFSYFIYFFHFFILESIYHFFKNFHVSLNFTGSFGLTFLVFFIFVIILSCLFALPSEKFIEKPFMKLARTKSGPPYNQKG
jgi:peptidoglycan/LPS O-acetylase OafA/YrhL